MDSCLKGKWGHWFQRPSQFDSPFKKWLKFYMCLLILSLLSTLPLSQPPSPRNYLCPYASRNANWDFNKRKTLSFNADFKTVYSGKILLQRILTAVSKIWQLSQGRSSYKQAEHVINSDSILRFWSCELRVHYHLPNAQSRYEVNKVATPLSLAST